MLWMCGWCPADRREILEIEPLEDPGITHGMCAYHECLTYIEVAERQWRKRHQEAA